MPNVNSALYAGHVTHERRSPIRRRFRYRVFMWWIDLDELDSLKHRLSFGRWSRLFGTVRGHVISVRSEDHLGRSDEPIKANVAAFLTSMGISGPLGRVMLLTNARLFGYVFNPLSLFYCYDRSEDLLGVVAEVHNTFGERHCYLIPAESVAEHTVGKEFYVSPFLAVSGRYRMRLSPPGQTLHASITLDQEGTDVFQARLTGRRVPIRRRSVLAMLMAYPLLTLRITALIHWQALLLWIHKVAVVPRRPGPPRDNAIDRSKPRPRSPTDRAHIAVARRLFTRAIHRMRDVRLTVVLPSRVRDRAGGENGDRQVIEVGDTRLSGPTMRVVGDGFYLRLATAGNVAFGEAYTAGEWETDDLPGVLTAFGHNLDRLRLPRILRPRTVVADLATHRNTLRGADANIASHYDLCNDFFALFLDPSMTYSAGVFADGDTLEQAQYRKYRDIAEMAGVTGNDHVLEIGTGWGGMAMFLAQQYGCRVTTTTLSRRQYEFAVTRITTAGIADRVTVLRQDYRDLTGSYSKIVSIEMFEAVGEEFWPMFFANCDRLLAPGGLMAMQTITVPHHRLPEWRTENWLQKHIFHGGALPSLDAIDEALACSSSLRVGAVREIGPHYVTTLRLWRAHFRDQLDAVRALGFDEEFIRTWDFYLSLCEAAFTTGRYGDAQLQLRRKRA